MLQNIQNAFISALDNQKRAMDISFDEVKQQTIMLLFMKMINNGASASRQTRGGPVNRVNEVHPVTFSKSSASNKSSE